MIAALLLALAQVPAPTAVSACLKPADLSQRVDLPRRRWTDATHAGLLALIKARGAASRGYDPCHRPLAVLGWEGVIVAGRPADHAVGLAQAKGWIDNDPEARRSERLAAIGVGQTKRALAELAAELQTGLVTPPETADLIAALTAAGWDVFVVTGAPGWLVRPHVATLGIAANRVVALDNRYAPNGKGTDELYAPIPVGTRKVEAVRTGVPPGGRIPALAVGTLKDRALLADARAAVVIGSPAPVGHRWWSQPSFE